MSDAFEILGVSKEADEWEIKQAFKRLALVHHPDVGGSTDMMSKLNAAFDTAMSSRIEAVSRETESTSDQVVTKSDRQQNEFRLHLVRDLPSFTIATSQREAFALLQIVAATMGMTVEEEPDLMIEFSLENSVALPDAQAWCRCDIIDAASSVQVNITIGNSRRLDEMTVMKCRDEIISIINSVEQYF